MRKAAGLKALMGGPRIVKVAGAHNPLGARLVQSAGFDAVWASGLEISATHALPDAGLLGMPALLHAASAMNDAVDLPVVADCDDGFGGPEDVARMVEAYEKAGIAAVCMEDKRLPKRNSLLPGRQDLASVAEFTGKISAAKRAQSHPDFTLIARVEALIAGCGMEEALARATAYEEAGADAVLIHSRSAMPDEVLEFARRWKGEAPLVVIPTTYPSIHCDELERAGIRMVIYANQGLRAMVRAMQETYEEVFRSGHSQAVESRIASIREIFDLLGMPYGNEGSGDLPRKGSAETGAHEPARSGKP